MIDLGELIVPYDRSEAIAERHESLLGLIQEGGRSCAALATALAVSQPTINRDLSYLRSKGHAIKARRIADGWAYELGASLGGPSASSADRI